MAKQSKIGVCENCGDKGALTGSFGRQVCSTCLKIRSNVNSHLPKIANAARSLGKGEELLAALVPTGGLAVKVTADLLQEISSIVGYDGEDPGELVAAVRKRVLTCASCEAEDVLHEIREIVGFSQDTGDHRLPEVLRVQLSSQGGGHDCVKCTTVRADLLKACGLEEGDADIGKGWDNAAAAAINEIARLDYKKRQAIDANYSLAAELGKARNEIARLNGQAHSESEQVTALRDDLTRSTGVIEQLRAEITLLEQAHDEWEQRAVQAEQNVETLEAELQERDRDEDRSFNRLGLLDIAIAALRGDAVPADQIAGLLAIARKVAA